MQTIDFHLLDGRGVYLQTMQIDPMGPLPGRGTLVSPPDAEDGSTRMLIGDAWQQVPDADVPPAAEPTPPSADQLRTALTAEYERRMQAIAAGCPPSERESWPVQTSEATALIADPQAATPWIDSAAVARGVDRFGLALRIVAKDAQYRVISGTLSGVRQRIEDAIDAAGDDAQALQAIDVTAGWPEA